MGSWDTNEMEDWTDAFNYHPGRAAGRDLGVGEDSARHYWAIGLTAYNAYHLLDHSVGRGGRHTKGSPGPTRKHLRPDAGDQDPTS